MDKRQIAEIESRICKKFGMRQRHATPQFARYGGRSRLIRLYADLGYTLGAEIGVARADHAVEMLEVVPFLTLYCVDPYRVYTARQEKRNRVHRKWAKHVLSKYPGAKRLQMTSMQALREIPDQSLDFVYIDGRHHFNYVATDLIFWSAKVRVGGIVAGHDYHKSYRTGVTAAVDAYTKCNGVSPWYVTADRTPSWFWVQHSEYLTEAVS